jgi:para-nitrobenzyl esterase
MIPSAMKSSRRQFLAQSGMTALAAYASPRLLAGSVSGASPVADTKYGRVRGAWNGDIAAFKGIPYGADTAQHRFQPPVAPAKWPGVRDCLAWGDRAPQLSVPTGQRPASGEHAARPRAGYHLPSDEGQISEDCLHLNVWSSMKGAAKRPVIVYIHGGAYNSGTVNADLYDGTRLARRGDAVVVTVNHRLNAYGYLYLAGVTSNPIFADAGNTGQLDLVLALQWVRDNIANFGGDSSRVLIFGQSGGGAKCATLMAMPAAHGLFHRVITMSGQQVDAVPAELATERARVVLDKLGIKPGGDLHELLTVPMEELTAAARTSSAWMPVNDGRSLTTSPFDPVAPAISASVPMILGNTHDETRGLIGAGNPALFSLTWEELPGALDKNVHRFMGPYTAEQVVAKYRGFYPDYSPTDVFFAAATALRSWPGQVIEAERRAESEAKARTWVYEMDWKSPIDGGKWGAPHTLDLAFFFDNLALSPGMIGASAEEIKAAQPLADTMSEMLIAFARTGNPNHAGLPNWPTYSLEKRETMVWNTVTAVVNDPRRQERLLQAETHYKQPGTYAEK